MYGFKQGFEGQCYRAELVCDLIQGLVSFLMQDLWKEGMD